MRKRNKVLGNLFTFQSLLVQCLQVYLEDPDTSSDATGMSLVSILSVLFTNLTLATTVKEVLTSLIGPLAVFYKHAASEPPRMSLQLLGKVVIFIKQEHINVLFSNILNTFYGASCSWRSSSVMFWAACRHELLWRLMMNCWLSYLLCYVFCFLTSPSCCVLLPATSGTPRLPIQSASRIPMRSGNV